MSIIINETTRILVQGITGNQGQFHTRQMLACGSKIVGGVSPGKGGQEVQGVQVFETVEEAMGEQQADASVIFVPARLVKDAALEAMDAGLKTLVIITEHVPLHDALELMAFAEKKQVEIIGPNTYGLISPGQSKIGIMPNNIFTPGEVGVVTRSGTLSYEIVYQLTGAGIGQSTVLGLGGDRVVGLSFTQVLEKFEADPQTKAVVLVGEIGGNAEEEAARYIKGMKKPVVAFLAGKSAPSGKRMGHAGAIIERGKGTFESKVEALTAAGVTLANLPWEVGGLVKQLLEERSELYPWKRVKN
ncbi:succinyl-CoA synthetase (ADP-forming) alpha subunit [Desulfosporosinus acidiphilus SJ4]|uniref:Succinate--CoA ligase [ADP-forming] subunit alpha n=1 Tax=Desulfosporosinus acidiphilus (strain DSM 22704 / JCM 16185 / SJ4) TaxID=646529 RepID=I4D4Z4_DESAJ|nr:succinate--CoA ligase subunit alpha [Desulfosporosinus acidiphilus]AFM40868.1 succinyl-CoA synthetase (ADP-forming) alpha subunit [Desulfosporosinus acidiphilus SJ4]